MNVSTSLHPIVLIIQKLLPKGVTVPLHEPKFSGFEWLYIKECIDTGWVSSVGSFVDRFEKDLAEYTGAKHAIVTVNGTAALHLSLLLAGTSSNDEVLVPTLTFIATCNAIHYCGAIPHFIDTEENHLGINTKKLADYLKDITIIKNNTCYNKFTNKPIRVLCVMHTFGHPVDLDALSEIADQYHLILVEDAAEAIGSFYKGKHVGHHGLLGALSFNGNKIITTGGGGAIVTNDTALAKRAKHISTTAKKPHSYKYYHDCIGYNYRMPNINAALGCAQLKNLPKFLDIKRTIFQKYLRAFREIDSVHVLAEPDYAKSNYWLNAIILDKNKANDHDEILTQLNEIGIAARPVWNLMHQLPMYRHGPRMDLSCAENMAKRVINLPSSVVLDF